MRSASLPRATESGSNGWRTGRDDGDAYTGRDSGDDPPRSSQESHEITLDDNATRLSMVEDMLLSLNTLPTAQGPFPPQQPFRSSFAQEPAAPAPVAPPSLAQRAIEGHRRAKSSVATTSSVSTVDAAARQDASTHTPPRSTAHARNATLTQANFGARQTANMTSIEGSSGTSSRRDSSARSTPHKSKSSISGPMTKQLVESPTNPRQGSVVSSSLSLSSPGSRSQSPARVAPESFNRDPNRRRSRSFNVSGSVLNRSRPVPAEYHVFDDTVRPGLRKSPSQPNTSSRMRDEYIPDMPADRSFPPSSYPAYSDPSSDPFSQRLGSSAMAPSSSQTSRDASSNFTGSSYTSSDGSKQRAESKVPPKSPSRDRPGFFKRMFGPSKTHSPSASAAPPQLPPLQVDSKRHEQSALRTPITPSSAGPFPHSPMTTAPATSAEPSPGPVPPQTLRQKSSFFRRRRKTTADKDAQATSHEDSPSTRHSSRPSTSSLRQAVDSVGVHDPMPDDIDLELVGRRQREEPQDAYSFLRSTAPPGSSGGPAKGRPIADPLAPPGSRFVVQRPSTSTDDVRAVDSPAKGRSRRGSQAAVDATPTAKSFRPATSPTAPSPNDVPLSSRSSQTPRQPKKAPPPPPLDVSASKREGRPRWPFSSSSRSNSEKGNSRASSVPNDDADQPPVPARPPNPRAPGSENSVITEDFTSAKSVPVVQVDDQEDDLVSPLPTTSEFGAAAPWASRDHERAQRIWDMQADASSRGQGSVELGEAGEAGDRLRNAFMSFFDFTGLNILLALRDLCGRMTLKGETQQLDRIIAAFAERWIDCNPNHGFKSLDIVHTIVYSLLLLNTDLHMAEVSEKMSQRQFVKNSMTAVRGMAAAEAAIDPNQTLKASRSQPRMPVPWMEGRPASPGDSAEGGASDRDSPRLGTPSTPTSTLRRRLSALPGAPSPAPFDSHPVDPSELLVNARHEGSMKSWEGVVETILKEFYTSIRQLRLPLHGATESTLHEQSSTNSLSAVSSLMRRTGSVMSKTPSEHSRGRGSELRSVGSRWSSKNRSKQRPYASSTLGSSRTGSRTSLDENIPWSPAASSTWSKSYGATQTTMSTDSLASKFAAGADPGYQQSIGFANALSHAIIREENQQDEEEQAGGNAPLLDDPSLELAGAPWAKEGIVQYKHHLETVDKKAKGRNWAECFAVVEKGVFRLFSFHKPKSSMRSAKTPKGAVVGGGNWLDNANEVATFMLRQTIANGLPPPGYSKTRPHVFALSMPTGAVHLFQVGTPEIAREFVSTANYWSARLSKEPLVGGVSSIEYGWGDAVVSSALNSPTSATMPPRAGPPTSYHLPRGSTSSGAPLPPGGGANTVPSRARHSPSPSLSLSPTTSSRPSLHESLRSSLDAAARPMRAKTPADRLALGDWTPPQQSLMASALPEPAQLAALERYIAAVEADLGRHNELRAAMAGAFTPRSANAARAMANWERKSSYLLREIVKFRTYVDALLGAAVEARRVKGLAGADGRGGTDGKGVADGKNAGAGAAAPSTPRRGTIRRVDSADSVDDDEADVEALGSARDLGLPPETIAAIRAASAASAAASPVAAGTAAAGTDKGKARAA